MQPTTSSNHDHLENDLVVESSQHENGTKFEQVKEKTQGLFLYWPFDYYVVSFLARILPPYTRLAIYFFCGMELVWNFFIMTLNQKFYEYSSRIFPVAYSMFIYTESRDKNDSFAWTKNDLHELNNYQNKLLYMWFISTIIVLYCVFCIIMQFFTFESAKGDKQTMCMRKPMLGYIMAPILLILMSIAFGLLLCQYYTFDFYYDLFQNLFSNSLQEEKFLSEIEYNLDCILDEDEENTGAWLCVTAIQRAMLSHSGIIWMLRIYLIWHALMIILGIFFNKKIQIFKKKEETPATTIEEGPTERLLNEEN